MFWTTLSLLTAASLSSCSGIHSSHLASYVTRPELRNPIFNVTINEIDAVKPGYWFTAPYNYFDASSDKREYIPYQAGPHIYDKYGELVWSGADFVDNRDTFDFRLSTVNGAQELTFMIEHGNRAADGTGQAAIFMDTSYRVQKQFHPSGKVPGFRKVDFDKHIFNVVNGKTSLAVFLAWVDTDISALGLPDKRALLELGGFRERDIETGEILFDWWPMEHGLSITETAVKYPKDWAKGAWDLHHINALDKNKDGDYLVSVRHTNSIVKVSHLDGSIIWRLGGKLSDFTQDFNFSAQHDSRFLYSNDSVTVISFLDNASDDQERQPDTAVASAVKVVALYEHETPMRAELIRQYVRPDGALSRKRGNAQIFSDDGAFVNWSEGGYLSEFASDGRCILEAAFLSGKYSTSRAYKFEFVGRPIEPPAMRTHAYGDLTSPSSMSTIFYVSWNGATEVVSWKFYGGTSVSEPYHAVGSVAKSGFETSFLTNRLWPFSYVEGVAANGTILGTSPITKITLPNDQELNLENITSDDFSKPSEYREYDERTVRLSTLLLIFVGLSLAGLISLAMVFWMRPSPCGRQSASSYSLVSTTEGAADASDLSGLKYANGDNDGEYGRDGKGRRGTEK